MEKEVEKFKATKSPKVNIFIFGLALAWIAIFTSGCEQSVKTTNDEKPYPRTKINDLRTQAFQIILEGLTDKDLAVRVNTIEVIAETRQIKLMPKVQRLLLNDQFVLVRFAAALAIGDLEYSLSTRAIRQSLKDPDDNVKIAASYAMLKLGHPEYLEILLRAIASTNQDVRANAALLLGKSGDKDAIKLLYWAMQDEDSEDKVSFQAAEAIAMLGDERIYPKLWTMLLSVYADVRVTGIWAMAALNTREAKNALIGMLDDKVLEVRLTAAEQLGKLKDPIGEPEVLQVFQKGLTAGLDKKERERVNVLTALAIGQIGTRSLTKFLPKLLNDESKFVRITAAKAVLQSEMKK